MIANCYDIMWEGNQGLLADKVLFAFKKMFLYICRDTCVVKRSITGQWHSGTKHQYAYHETNKCCVLCHVTSLNAYTVKFP